MVLIIVFLILTIVFFTYNVCHDKLMFLITKLDNIEEKINSTLITRKELLKDSEVIIRELTKTDKIIYDGLDEIKDNVNMMELDRKLLICVNAFHLIEKKYSKLQKNDEFQKVAFKITETEDLLKAYKTYYNDNAAKYNKFIKRFPIIIFTILKRRKEKLFFDNKKQDDVY